MAKGPYFIWQPQGHLLLGTDGKMHDKGEVLRSGLLCKFGTMNAAKNYIKDCGDKTLQTIASKTARRQLEFPEEVWNQILKLMHEGVDPGWKPTYIWDSGRSALVKALTNPDISPAPQDSSCPSPIPVDGVEEAPALVISSKPNGLQNSPASLAATWETPLMEDTIDLLEQAAALADRWAQEKPKLGDRLHKLEQAICDELHFVEFMDLDGRRAYNSYKRLHQYRLERRLVKNEQDVLTILTQTLGCTPERLGDLAKKALNCINGCKNRRYSPRTTWPVEDDRINF